jgi:hypothetical protein
MIEIFISAAFVAVGILICIFARQISNWEKRLAEAYSWTKVTGWSGTRKGILVWRCIGAMSALLGVALMISSN